MSEQEVSNTQSETETPRQDDVPVRAPGSKLYNQNLEIFRQSIAENLEDGLRRYGFALFHSLPAEEIALRREDLGLEPKTADEYYNLGCAHAARNDFDKALACWRKALEHNSIHAEAVYNIAVALERQGDMQGAISHFRRYLEIAHRADDISEVESHLASLGS